MNYASPTKARTVEAAVGLGSNVGHRLDHLSFGLEKLLPVATGPGHLSRVYETHAIDCLEPLPFLNAVWVFQTQDSARKLLNTFHQIEALVGRIRSYPNAPRPLDLDLLYYGEATIQTQDLWIPHPRIQNRCFVLTPLAEIRPHWVHPFSHQTISQLLTAARTNHPHDTVTLARYQWSDENSP